MKTYTAIDKSGLSIISVGAESLADSKPKIEEQLNRPGRSIYIDRWAKTMRRLTKSDMQEASSGEWVIDGVPVKTSYITDILKTGGVVLVDCEE